jgi:hypothetical protein
MPQQQTNNLKVLTTTLTTDDGDDCVERDPGRIVAKRADVDVLRLINGNDKGSDHSITIMIDPASAAGLLDPVPSAETTLAPGQSVDWTVKAVIDGTVGMKFRTDPDTCTGSDQNDFVIEC